MIIYVIDIHRVRERTLDSQTSLFGFLLLSLAGISQQPCRGISTFRAVRMSTTIKIKG